MSKYIKIEFYGHAPERFVNMCKHKEIELWDLTVRGNNYTCYMYANHFKNIKSFARKTKVHIRIIERHGLAFWLFRYRKRKLFFMGIILAISIIYGLTRFIWQIDIAGNVSVTDDVLYEYLQENNIYHGMRRSAVDCDAICKKIRLDFNEIIWVSTSLEGTHLEITVREGSNPGSQTEESTDHPDIIANVDGTIFAMITRAGMPQVNIGDSVKKGDILVSSIIEIKNDNGETIREAQTTADADIWIKYCISYHDFCENRFWRKNYEEDINSILGLRMGEISFRIGKKSDTAFQEVISEYHSLKFNDYFVLPLEIETGQVKEYSLEEDYYTKEEQQAFLKQQYEYFCKELAAENIEIISESLNYYEKNNSMIYQGELEVIQQVVDLY